VLLHQVDGFVDDIFWSDGVYRRGSDRVELHGRPPTVEEQIVTALVTGGCGNGYANWAWRGERAFSGPAVGG
jgi:hypothetical protein